jgi:AraC-like DNA-binding protein
MSLTFGERASDSPLVESVWSAQSSAATRFMSVAASHWEMVITRHEGRTSLTVRGPETFASVADCPPDAEFFGIQFKHGTFMPLVPVRTLLNRNDVRLPDATSRSFWLDGSAWEFPTYDNVETFVQRLVRRGLVVREPVVEAALRGQLNTLSLRSVQRRFVQTTGLTHSAIVQIERARHALSLLERGVSILDTVYKAGYADQPHLTRALKRLTGQTPAQILLTKQL